MAQGKNKLLRFARLIFDGYDLSGDARTFDSAANMIGEVEMTGWSDSIKQYLPFSQREIGIRGFSAWMNDDTDGSFTAMSVPGVGHEVSLLLGGGAAPTTGDVAYLMAGVTVQARHGYEGGASVIAVDLLSEGAIESQNPNGVILFNESMSATTNGAQVDFGAASTNGGWQANLHVLSTSSGDFEFKIQHAVTPPTWVDLTNGTFSIDGSAVASEHLGEATGIVNQYVRGVATRTAGTVLVVMTFARN